MEKEEWQLPVDFRTDKRYIGVLVYYRKIYMGEDLGRVHDWTSDGKLVPHIIEDGKCPSCCKEYEKQSSALSIVVDTICECRKHWIYVNPQSGYHGSTEIRVFILKKKIKKKITLEEFFEVLSTTPREWKFRAGTREDKIELITLDSTEGRAFYIQDPLTAVATELTDCYYHNDSDFDWHKAGKDIGLSHEDIMAIFRATNKLEGYDEQIRKKLLESTNLP